MKEVALIIGGSSGIGASTADLLLSKNYEVYQISRHASLNPRVTSYVCDVINDENLKKTVAEIIKKEKQIDVLVYSAGCSMAAPLEYTKKSEYHYLFNVNFFSIIEVIKCIVPTMKNQKKGKIIIVSSLASSMIIPFDTFYSASKAAVDTLSLGANLELNQHNIYVTSILPGGTKTNFTYKRRINNTYNNEYQSLSNAVKRLEKMEQRGMSPERVAKIIWRQIKKDNPKILVVVGIKNKIYYVISKIIPKKWLCKVIKKTYFLS